MSINRFLDQRAKRKERDRQPWRREEEFVINPSIYRGRAGRARGGGVARGRPLLPRGGATALGGGATELMGDVVIFLLSERQTDKQTGETETERGGQTGEEDKRM